MARLTEKLGRGLIGHAVAVAEIAYEPARQFAHYWLRRLILPKCRQALDAIQKAAEAPGSLFDTVLPYDPVPFFGPPDSRVSGLKELLGSYIIHLGG